MNSYKEAFRQAVQDISSNNPAEEVKPYNFLNDTPQQKAERIALSATLSHELTRKLIRELLMQQSNFHQPSLYDIDNTDMPFEEKHEHVLVKFSNLRLGVIHTLEEVVTKEDKRLSLNTGKEKVLYERLMQHIGYFQGKTPSFSSYYLGGIGSIFKHTWDLLKLTPALYNEQFHKDPSMAQLVQRVNGSYSSYLAWFASISLEQSGELAQIEVRRTLTEEGVGLDERTQEAFRKLRGKAIGCPLQVPSKLLRNVVKTQFSPNPLATLFDVQCKILAA